MNRTPILCALVVSCCLLSGFSPFEQSVFGQSTFGQANVSRLSAADGMKLLRGEKGRWEGTRETYSNGQKDESVKTRLAMFNKIEANSWLYFQTAETSDQGTRITKGTLALDSATGQFVRRWFDNGSPEIKSCPVVFDGADNTFTYSWTTPGATPEPDEQGEFGDGNVVIGDGDPSTIYSTEIAIRDPNTRVIKIFTQPAGNPGEARTLRSVVILARVPNVARAAKRNMDDKNRNRLPVNDRAQQPTPSTPKTPVGHTLLVKVKIASSDLKQDQKPMLEISPDDSSPKRIDQNTFEFSGLKSGVEYTVKGEYQIESGFRVFTSGETKWKFDKDAKFKITKTRYLTLEGN